MIVGTSMDAKAIHVYRNKEEPFNYIEVDFVSKEDLMHHVDEFYDDYEFVEERVLSCVNDNWHQAMDFNSENIGLLIECDYCGKHFTSIWSSRRSKATRYLGYFNGKTGSSKINDELIDLYKDNCKKCSNNKKRETSMIRSGYWHPSHNPAHKDTMKDVFIKYNMVPTSRGQRYIAKLLGAELNIPIGYYFADIVLDDKIIIEYDGGGHNLSVLRGNVTQKQFDEAEAVRSSYMFSKGYKILRISSPSEYFPEDEQYFKSLICESIADLYISSEEELYIEFSSKVNDRVHGKLKPIKSILGSSEWGADIL